MTKSSLCPSDFALERWRFGELAASEGEAQIVAHVANCAACRLRQADLAQTKQPALDTDEIWSRAAGSRKRQKWQWPTRAWQGAALAGAALSALLLFSRSTPQDTMTKGSGQLGVIVKDRGGNVTRIDSGALLSPGDRLRFEVATHWPQADIALVLLDSAGKVSQLAPSGGRRLSISGGKRVLLDEAVELDGTVGPERIVLVACVGRLDLAAIVASAERSLAAAGGDPRKVPSLGTGCHEESFWITKGRR